jgi:hypothetical protein
MARIGVALGAALVLLAGVTSATAQGRDQRQAKGAGAFVFDRYVDRTEGAFLVLVPKGWMTEGGIVRVNPLTAAGPAQAIEAKIDFAVKREKAGKVAVRYLPKITYAEPSPGNAMLGGNWNGMPVVAMPTPENFMLRMLLPHLRPGASGVEVVERKNREDVAAAVRNGPAAKALIANGAHYRVAAASVTVTYTEAGVKYREVFFTAIEGFSMMGTGLWSNPFTVAARSPEAEYKRYEPVAKVIFNSFALNPRWMAAEMKGQTQRAKIVNDTMADIRKIDAEIAANRSKTMAEINDKQYLVLTGQERYVNPHTGQMELGSNEWKHRWEDSSGRVIYTDDGNWDPNYDPDLKLSGFKRSQARGGE